MENTDLLALISEMLRKQDIHMEVTQGMLVVLNEHTEILTEHSEKFKRIELRLDEHSERFDRIEEKQKEHSEKFIAIELKLDEHTAKLEEHSIILNEHSIKHEEHSRTSDRLNRRIDRIYDLTTAQQKLNINLLQEVRSIRGSGRKIKDGNAYRRNIN